MLMACGCKHVGFRQRVLKLKKSRSAVLRSGTHAQSAVAEALAGAKPTFKGSLEKGPTSPLGLNGSKCVLTMAVRH